MRKRLQIFIVQSYNYWPASILIYLQGLNPFKVRFTDGKTIETPHKNLSGTIAMGEKVYFHGKMGCIIRVKLGFFDFLKN